MTSDSATRPEWLWSGIWQTRTAVNSALPENRSAMRQSVPKMINPIPDILYFSTQLLQILTNLLPILLSQASAKNESRTFEDDSKESEDDRPLSRYSPYSKFLPNLTYYFKILRFQPSATSNQAWPLILQKQWSTSFQVFFIMILNCYKFLHILNNNSSFSAKRDLKPSTTARQLGCWVSPEPLWVRKMTRKWWIQGPCLWQVFTMWTMFRASSYSSRRFLHSYKLLQFTILVCRSVVPAKQSSAPANLS